MGSWIRGHPFRYTLGEEGQEEERRLELEPPDFDIPQFGGGDIRKRYPLQFKVNAVRKGSRERKDGVGVSGYRTPAGSLGSPIRPCWRDG